MDNGLVQKFEYFMKRTEDDLSEIKEKVGKLWEFRIAIVMGSLIVSTICSALVSVAYLYLGIHH